MMMKSLARMDSVNEVGEAVAGQRPVNIIKNLSIVQIRSQKKAKSRNTKRGQDQSHLQKRRKSKVSKFRKQFFVLYNLTALYRVD